MTVKLNGRLQIKQDALVDERVIQLIEIHLSGMEYSSPPESRHALIRGYQTIKSGN